MQSEAVAHETLIERLRRAAERAPEAPALLAPARQPLTHAALRAHLESTGAELRRWGIQPGERVAIVLPNGPELATTFLSVAAVAASAPLNPAYRASEFDFYLSDLKARALIVPAGSDSPAVAVARARGIALLELTPCLSEPAGLFTLSSAQAALPACEPDAAAAVAERPALLLHTSGTTARPKLVVLTQRNLAASAGNITRSLALTPSDRGLNVMPLFHIHGLMAGLAAGLASGGSVVATPGFDAPRFLDWLDEFEPTWYTAVPTMHQAVLARAAERPAGNLRGRLRLVRSASAALPRPVQARLEEVFGAPTIEAYGMTETTQQMAANPLPPGRRKPGSVGLAMGTEIAIVTPGTAERLPPGTVGEVVVRGPSVTPGYADNPAANREAFAQGWFHTGDQGYLDEDGYLYLTGRLKELINRGGEKVAPGEVEEALLAHPAVAQAVAFALPDARLGEAVGAAIVARPGAAAGERDLRRFAAERLADFKVPSRIVTLEVLPTGATGKVQRIGLAARLGLTGEEAAAPAPYAPPEGEIEHKLAAMWESVLARERVGRHDRFLDLGGDSLLAMQLAGRVAQMFAVELPLLDFFDAATLAEQARLVAQRTGAAGGAAAAITGSL